MKISVRIFLLLSLLLCFSVSTWAAGKREVKMTTFFPVPYAAYQQVNVTNELQMGLSRSSNIVIAAESEDSDYSLKAPVARLQNPINNGGNGTLDISADRIESSVGLTIGNFGNATAGETTLKFKNLYMGRIQQQDKNTTAKVDTLASDKAMQMFGAALPACKIGNADGIVEWKYYSDANGGSRWVLACVDANYTTQTEACTKDDVQVENVGNDRKYAGVTKSQKICGTKTCLYNKETGALQECSKDCVATPALVVEFITQDCGEVYGKDYPYGSRYGSRSITYTCAADGSAAYTTTYGDPEWSSDDCHINKTVKIACSELHDSGWTGWAYKTYQVYADGHDNLAEITKWDESGCVEPDKSNKCYKWNPKYSCKSLGGGLVNEATGKVTMDPYLPTDPGRVCYGTCDSDGAGNGLVIMDSDPLKRTCTWAYWDVDSKQGKECKATCIETSCKDGPGDFEPPVEDKFKDRNDFGDYTTGYWSCTSSEDMSTGNKICSQEQQNSRCYGECNPSTAGTCHTYFTQQGWCWQRTCNCISKY